MNLFESKKYFYVVSMRAQNVHVQGAFQNKRDFFKIAIYSGAIF